MTIFAVYDRATEPAPLVVADRFSWFAALLPPIFALVHGLWLELAVYVLGLIGLFFASAFIGDAASFWIYVAFAVWLGVEAAGLRRAALARRGWRFRTDVVAPAEDMAQLEGLKLRP